MVAWGQWLHGTGEYAWMTTYPDDLDYKRDMTAAQKLHVTVLARAHAFLMMLDTDQELRQAAVDPYWYGQRYLTATAVRT